jgi:predicted nucleotidyltransferase component of viral defense system
MKGLAPNTEKIFETVSRLESIKPYVLVGGTALSLQIDHRKSEDLDFMRWSVKKGEKVEVDWPKIEKELKTIDPDVKTEIFDFNHVVFEVHGVRISFYAAPRKSPVKETVACLNNIVLADIDAIASMKMEVLLRRAKYRDYYDLFCILKDKEPSVIKEIIANALTHSEHRLSSKSLLAMLTNGSHFSIDNGFDALEPQISTNITEIEEFMKDVVHKAYISN